MDPQGVVAVMAAGASVAAGAGAAAGLTDVVKTGIIDAYAACKKALRARFGDDEDAKEKLAQLEVKPDDATLQQALADYLATHQVDQDPGVAGAVDQLQVQLARIEGGISSISTGAVIGNTLTADRGGIAAVNITGGAHAGYTAPPADPDPH